MGSEADRLRDQGETGRTSAVVHADNCRRTDAMSDRELATTVNSRESTGMGAGQARAALRRRGYNY